MKKYESLDLRRVVDVVTSLNLVANDKCLRNQIKEKGLHDYVTAVDLYISNYLKKELKTEHL